MHHTYRRLHAGRRVASGWCPRSPGIPAGEAACRKDRNDARRTPWSLRCGVKAHARLMAFAGNEVLQTRTVQRNL